MTGMSVTGAPSWKLQNKMSQASSKRIVEFDPFCAKPLTHKMDTLAMEGQSQILFLRKLWSCVTGHCVGFKCMEMFHPRSVSSFLKGSMKAGDLKEKPSFL